MNQTQVRYARDRAEQAFNRKKAAIKVKHTTPGVKLTTEQKLAALKNGEFKVGKEKTYYWHDRIEFTAAREEKVDQDAIDRDTAVLTASYTKLVDELVLGDNEAALKMLRDFEAE